MHIIDSWQETPAPVDLRVVPVNLRPNKEQSRRRKTESQRRDKGVRGEVDLLQGDHISARFLQRCRE